MAVQLESLIISQVPRSSEDGSQLPSTLPGKLGPAKLTGLVDSALSAKKFSEAHLFLKNMLDAGIPVDLAARWQWVRNLNLMTGFSRQTTGFDRRTERDHSLMPLLITLLSAAGPKDTVTETTALDGYPILAASVLDFRKSKTDQSPVPSPIAPVEYDAKKQDELRAKFRIIPDSSSGNQPSSHGRTLPYFASEDDAIPLEAVIEVTHHVHPAVPNLHFLQDVLSKEECRSIINAAETVGFIKLGTQSCAPGGLSWHWVTDETFAGKLWSRVEKSVPATFGGRAVRGLNRWFRVHRHVPGQEFPAHFDGAWPPSGIDQENDSYVPDSSPPDAKQVSRLTFLIYLNDYTTDGGETTFFVPSATSQGQLNAHSVRPVEGGALLFPHGEAEEALFHEGATVPQSAENLPKYVIRTEVIYDL